MYRREGNVTACIYLRVQSSANSKGGLMQDPIVPRVFSYCLHHEACQNYLSMLQQLHMHAACPFDPVSLNLCKGHGSHMAVSRKNFRHAEHASCSRQCLASWRSRNASRHMHVNVREACMSCRLTSHCQSVRSRRGFDASALG